MATYYVTSADVGAPALTGVNGSGTAVVQYIAGVAGLTVLYTGSNKCVVQMSNGDVLRFVHDSGFSGDARLMHVRAAESATDVDTLVDPWPLVSIIDNTSCNWVVSFSADSTARSWWALVDTVNHCFYLFVDTVGGGYCAGGMWFASSSLLPVDSFCSYITTRASASVSIGTSLPLAAFGVPSTTGTTLWCKRSRDGTTKSVRGFFGPYGGTASPSVSSGPAFPHPDDGTFRKSKIFAGDNNSQTSTAGPKAEPVRVFVPHLWTGLHAVSSYTGVATGNVFANTAYNPAASFTLLVFGSAGGIGGAAALETTDTWETPAP